MRVTSRGAPGLVKTERAAQGGRVLHDEYEALRNHAGVFALDDRVLVRATGADRVGFLQGMLTNDVATLRPGDGCAALLLTIQGRVVADERLLETLGVLRAERRRELVQHCVQLEHVSTLAGVRRGPQPGTDQPWEVVRRGARVVPPVGLEPTLDRF